MMRALWALAAFALVLMFVGAPAVLATPAEANVANMWSPANPAATAKWQEERDNILLLGAEENNLSLSIVCGNASPAANSGHVANSLTVTDKRRSHGLTAPPHTWTPLLAS